MTSTKDSARAAIRRLVEAYSQHDAAYRRPSYNETQARTEFVTPLIEALGWDVHNRRRLPPSLREVVEEATLAVEEDAIAKKPDYELRLARERKLFVEAKKPAIPIKTDRKAAFQTRRYGYSAGLPFSVLTNFREFAVYDTTVPPDADDAANVARIMYVSFDQLDDALDELWDYVSRESVETGRFDELAGDLEQRRGAETFDELFLNQVKEWRLALARDVIQRNPGISESDLTYAVQLFLSRLVFLRICEDRGLERYEQLRGLDPDSTYQELLSLVGRVDTYYDSGLFDSANDRRLGIVIGNDVLRAIIDELYYPKSPYTFAVVEAELLGHIYEQFLGEELVVEAGAVRSEPRPEVRESNGVVPTPRYVVDQIVARSLGRTIRGASPTDLAEFRLADICCGSGVFLLSAFELLCDHYQQWYESNGDPSGTRLQDTPGGSRRLSFAEKRRILVTHIFGVDIDSEAVEIAQLSLLIKLIEEESAADLAAFREDSHDPVLPDLTSNLRAGNSLISRAEWERYRGRPTTAAEETSILPFDWNLEFPDFGGRFSAIVGNPPYIRIQNISHYAPDEVAFYRDRLSPYTTAATDNFDKYFIFVERALSLLTANGIVGYITPHKFMSITAGRGLRRLLATSLSEIVHFSALQIFDTSTTYTAILIAETQPPDNVRVEMVSSIPAWRYGGSSEVSTFSRSHFGEEPWVLLSGSAGATIEAAFEGATYTLGEVADIFVGVQTSADEIYILDGQPAGSSFLFEADGRRWEIEAEILKPCIQDVELQAYSQPRPNRWMIFPYRYEAGRAKLLTPNEMRRRFPKAWAYLKTYEDALEERSITGGPSGSQEWYQFGRSQSLTKFGSDKIILPILSTEPRYAFDELDTIVTGGGNGPYYMVRGRGVAHYSNEVLLAILNHPLSEAVVRSNTSIFRGGYYSHGKQFIERIPLPAIGQEAATEIEQLVEQLREELETIRTTRTRQSAVRHQRRATSIASRLSEIVSLAHGLSAEEVAGLEQVVPR